MKIGLISLLHDELRFSKYALSLVRLQFLSIETFGTFTSSRINVGVFSMLGDLGIRS